MANQKISEMQEVKSITPDDLFYVVQDSISSHITAASLFGKLPDVLLSGSLQLDTIESVVTNGGNISDDHVVTALTVDNIDRTFYLSTGTVDSPLPNFMFKVVYVKTAFEGKAIIKGGFTSNITQVVLDDNSKAAVFMSTPLGWIVLCTTGTVTYTYDPNT